MDVIFEKASAVTIDKISLSVPIDGVESTDRILLDIIRGLNGPGRVDSGDELGVITGIIDATSGTTGTQR